MRSAACAILLVLATMLPACAQSPPGEPIRVALRAAGPVKPSLRYRLLPDRSDLLAGNSAAGYYRALALLVDNQQAVQEIKRKHWSDWQSRPLKELPLAEVKTQLALCKFLVAELEIAARKRTCDWELDGRPEGLGLLLPDAQAMRSIAMVLAIKARTEIAERQFDKAIHTLQTGFALGKHFGEGPTFIHILIGLAITRLMDSQVDELIQQPGAPNLYWALTALPRPMFALDHALAEESTMVERMLPWLRTVENGPMTPEQVRTAQAQIQKMLHEFAVSRPADDEENRQLLMADAFVTAKKALLDQGMTARQIEAMPEFQVVALHAIREYRLAWEEVAKWNHVTDGWRQANYQADAKRFREATVRLDLLFFHGLLEGLTRMGNGESLPMAQVANGIGSIERRLAAQRCLEALRAYAAVHAGKLPAKLDDITELPVPLDPVLHRPFAYRVTGANQATLSAAAPPDAKDNKHLALTYEVTLKAGR